MFDFSLFVPNKHDRPVINLANTILNKPMKNTYIM